MAYRGRYNPDALPAFAEPDRPGGGGGSNSSSTKPQDNYANKPPPPAPVQNLRDDRRPTPPSSDYRQQSSSSSAKYDDRRYQPDPRQQPPPRGSSYDSPTSSSGYGRDPRDNRDPRDRRSDPRDREQRDKEYGRDYRSGGQQPQGGGGGVGGAPPQRAPRDGNDRDALWPMFNSVDRDHSGQLSEQELSKALVNGDYTSFDPHTVKMMIRMFDVDRSGTISFDEFCGLWGFLTEWRKLFDRFDVDRSGTISFDEFTAALVAFGYRLSNDYVGLLFNTYDVKRRGVLSFDLFVQACISLKRMTDVFKKYDTDRDGYITLSFEQFLTEALKQR